MYVYIHRVSRNLDLNRPSQILKECEEKYGKDFLPIKAPVKCSISKPKPQTVRDQE